MRSTRERRVKRNPIYRALENFGEFICLFWFKYVYFKSGIEQRSARLAHNQKVVGSNPTPATLLRFAHQGLRPYSDKKEEGTDESLRMRKC